MRTIINVDPAIKVRKEIELLDMPIRILVREFTSLSVDQFSKGISAALNTSQPVIPVVIDSYGGQVYSLQAMISLIESCPKPVATIALGKAMSCGAILLGNGTKGYRFADQHSTIMIHDVSSGGRGKLEEIKANVQESERLNKAVYHRLAKKCGHKNKDYFFKRMAEKKQADWYLTASMAKSHGLVDHIGLPEMLVEVKVDMKFIGG